MQNVFRTKCLTQCLAVNRDAQGEIDFCFDVGLFFQLCGVKERISPLQGATLQLLGQALCGGSPSLRFYLQQWQRSCRKRTHKLIHSSGGVQWGSAGNGKGQSESCWLFIHKARTLQVAVHLYHCVCHLWSEENGSELWRIEDPAQSSQFVQVSYGFGHSCTREWPWLLSHIRSAFGSKCCCHHILCFVWVSWCFKNKTPQNNRYKHPARKQMNSTGPAVRTLFCRR